MIKRQIVTKQLAEKVCRDQKIVSCLGRISRDLFQFIPEKDRYNCFYMTGAMGSVLPFSIGLGLAIPEKKIWAIEGDGSILMNMGGLATYKRYNPANLTLFILDNRQYETTGGQCSQPANFKLNEVCVSIGLKTICICDEHILASTLGEIVMEYSSFDVVVIQTLPDQISPRIKEQPCNLSENFKKTLW